MLQQVEWGVGCLADVGPSGGRAWGFAVLLVFLSNAVMW